MAERQNRGRYFLNRRDFSRGPTQEPRQPEAISAQPIEEDSAEDKEIESKLQSLYDSLGTSFWDTEPKPKYKKVKPEKLKRQREKVDYKAKAVALWERLPDVAKTRRAGIVACAVLAVGLGGLFVLKPAAPTSGSITSVKGASIQNIDQAGYTPLLPKNAQHHDQAEAALQYEATKKVFTYNDSIGNGKGIIISQQPLPDEYRKDPINGLQAIASNIGASDWLASSMGKVYLVNNENGKGQTAIFTTENILVIMRSTQTITQNEWKKYIDQLEN